MARIRSVAPSLRGNPRRPAGLAGYLTYVATRTGSPDGWFGIQERGWGWTFDFGLGALAWIGTTLTTDPRLFDAVQVATVLAYLALLAIIIHREIPWPLVAYTAGVIMITLGASGVITTTRARYLVPAFIVFLPVALGLARRKNSTVWATLVSVALVSSWLGVDTPSYPSPPPYNPRQPWPIARRSSPSSAPRTVRGPGRSYSSLCRSELRTALST